MIKNQEKLIRKVTQIGNGAHIFAPKDWLGEEIFIIRKPRKTLKEKIILDLMPHLENIEGVYLYGSHAREEAESNSDIDLLIISTKKVKINKQGYEIITLEKKAIPKILKIAPIMIYSALSEAKPLINSQLLKELKKNHKPKLSNFKRFVKDTKRIIQINREFLQSKKTEHIKSEAIPYSLILRLRGIFIIIKLLKNQLYSHKKFREWILNKIPNLDYDTIYNSYRLAKINKKSLKLKKKDLENLLHFLEQENKKLERKNLCQKEKSDLKEELNL